MISSSPPMKHSLATTVDLLSTDSIPIHAILPDQRGESVDLGILVIKTDKDNKNFPIKRNSNITVGRSRSSSIVLTHPTISSNHLFIYSVMAPPNTSNPLIFCRDLGSSNGTYFKSRRLLKDETVLLNHGDCLDFRHAGRIYLLQFNVCLMNVDKIIGMDVNLSGLEKTFQIQRRLIGEGGQAKILLARNRHTRQQIACKVVRLTPSKPKQFENTKREITFLSTLHHPNVIKIFSAFQTPTSLIIMEPLLCGGDLHNFIFGMHTSGLDEFNAKFIIFQLLKATEYLHTKDIVHRDLKLENILLQRPGIPALIKLTDFGLARLDPSPTKRMTSFCGSIDFLAPEMVKMFRKDHVERGYGKEIDIWAIGVISFALMSGELPFSESDDDEDSKIMRLIVSSGVAFGPAWENKSLVAKLFVRKCLSKRAGNRPCATEALGHKFIVNSLTELDWLYEDSVLKPWVAKDGDVNLRTGGVKHEKHGQILSSETGEMMQDLSQMALGEIDANGLEGRERKRQVVEMDEWDQENDSVNERRKKRRVDI